MSGASGRSASSGDPQPSRDRWTTLEPLIDAALELPREQRAAFLDRASGGDAPLRAELEGFLTECDRPDRMLDLPAAAIFSSLLDQGPLRLPTVLGERYRIEREIGHGGMATVYLAEDVRHERKVAVKVLHPELAAAVGAERFLAEIRMTAQLQHPHILPLHDSGETGGVLFYVMPYVEGGSLRRHMEREKQLPVEDALRIACEVASALDAAHRQGVIHRDIKPENILLQNGAALVADFGIALAVSTAASTRLTKSGLTVGTPQYMSPEQATGERAIDGRSDIYSLGAVLYEMLAGEPPFTGTTTTAVIAKLVALPAPSLRVVRPGVTVALDAVVARVLSREPADRYRTAGEFAEALASATPVSTPKAPSSRLSRHVARPSLLTIGAVATILTIAIMSRPWESRNSPNIATLADTTRLVILPLEHDLPVPLANGLDAMLYDAFSRFQGLRLVGHFQVRSGLVGKKLDAAITASELTRSFGAGRYVRAQIVPIADSFQVSAALYDVRRNEELYHASVRLDRQLKNVDSIFDALAGAVLLRRANANVERGTTVVPALQAFASGQAMLDEWDLPGADSLFGAALTYDRTYRRAGYWLAQVRAWQALPPSQWSAQADFSLADSGQLLPGERPLAHALVALGQQRYADACHIYERLKKDNDRDFMAWYGLGQCVEMDHAVVADSTSRSRWRFRSSYYRAILAYQRALVLLPLA
ncbi:MAG TPA: serine/threonine-protein kinase, partial [Gemmatimonadaceae bacterium]|nr:serine/threonine-protein kinase [Gemmatimonadaceae bacterium]